jgi:hypothetical protein
LTPDLYYSLHLGYQDFLPDEVPDWSSREDKLFWRGATTGAFCIYREALPTLPRYRLCTEAKKLGAAADVGIYSVVQAANEDERDAIMACLRANDLLAGWVDIHDYAKYRYIVQIGGNASSWGLIQKLRLGCCIFFVEGEWNSWFERYLQPWVHYIPVRADLADFEQRAQEARQDPAQAESIARNGRALALSLDFAGQMSQAAAAIATAFGPLPPGETPALPAGSQFHT